MNYDIFLETVKDLAYKSVLSQIQEQVLVPARYPWDGDKWENYLSYYHDKESKHRTVLYVEWSTGGASGGSCWNDDPAESYWSSSSPEELTLLDSILERFCPNMSFLQYRKLTNTVCKSGTRTENEYYGNYTNYAFRMVILEDLWNYLEENQLYEQI